MRNVIEPARLAYRGVLIERPCAFCNTTSVHLDGKCNDGPCTVCGLNRHVGGWFTHPATADGVWRGRYDEPLHDWTAHEYLPADIDQDLPAFEAIVDAARDLGMPWGYTSDLFRDYQFVASEPNTRFLWIVRDQGTHIVVPSTTGAVGAAKYLRDNERNVKVFWWNGLSLMMVTWDMALTLMTRVYPTRKPVTA